MEVCGGVWRDTTDIRLGDVIVSHPEKWHGSVVQWDVGKMDDGGALRRAGTRNKATEGIARYGRECESQPSDAG